MILFNCLVYKDNDLLLSVPFISDKYILKNMQQQLWRHPQREPKNRHQWDIQPTSYPPPSTDIARRAVQNLIKNKSDLARRAVQNHIDNENDLARRAVQNYIDSENDFARRTEHLNQRTPPPLPVLCLFPVNSSRKRIYSPPDNLNDAGRPW